MKVYIPSYHLYKYIINPILIITFHAHDFHVWPKLNYFRMYFIVDSCIKELTLSWFWYVKLCVSVVSFWFWYEKFTVWVSYSILGFWSYRLIFFGSLRYAEVLYIVFCFAVALLQQPIQIWKCVVKWIITQCL